jgi:hypothetical protein
MTRDDQNNDHRLKNDHRNRERDRTQSSHRIRRDLLFRRHLSSLRAAALILPVVFSLPSESLQAQEIRGLAVEEGSGRPLAGAFVSLTDETGQVAISALTASGGTFVLSGFPAGRYHLRLERIGYETWESGSFRVDATGTVTKRLEVPVQPVDLTELHVAVEGRCASGGESFTRAWNEARKALDLTRWTENQRSLRFELRSWERDLNAQHRSRGRDESQTRWIEGRTSFLSLSAQSLADSGYIRRTGNASYQYYGPDARVLLSDLFREQHCFQFAEGTRERAGELGLTFEPIDRDLVPDVQGALWLDAKTGELRELDFQYTGLHLAGLPLGDDATGHLEFRRLPSGAWFVNSWWIRTPVHEREVGRAARVVGFREAGGEVTRIELEDGAMVTLAEFGRVTGVVTDGLGGSLAGAEVYLVGTDLSSRTDPAGRFGLDLVPPGRYSIAVRHPDPRLRGLSGPEYSIDVHAEYVGSFSLEYSGENVVAQLCPEGTQANEEQAVLLGRVLDNGSATPVPGAVVWLRPNSGQNTRAFRADSTGTFLACGVEPSPALEIQASSDNKLSEPATLEVEPGTLVMRDLVVSVEALADSRTAPVETVALRGVVRSAEDESPLSGAFVKVLGTDIQQLTGSDGTFLIQGLPRGEHLLVTEYLGMASDTARVDLSQGGVTLALFTMETRPVELPALEVAIERTFGSLQIAGFHERRARGLGDFIGTEDLRFGDIISAFRRLPGIRLQNCSYASRFSQAQGSDSIPRINMVQTDCWEIKMQRGVAGLRSNNCSPVVYLDGNPISSSFEGIPEIPTDGPFNRIAAIPRDLIEGIEVHRNAATAPAMYRGFGSRCGVILVWTKRGRRR